VVGSWLMIAKGSNRQHAGNLGYKDIPAASYKWDSTVGNHSRPQLGDNIALWDGEILLGASIIAEIFKSEENKIRRRCPNCGQTRFKGRLSTSPRYRCHNQLCRSVFDQPEEELIIVDTYATQHEAGWVDLSGKLDGHALRNLCLQPRSQQSIRPLNWARFLAALDSPERNILQLAEKTAAEKAWGGHATILTRVRKGQGRFRKRLLLRFGAVCALTGPSPVQALDAAHLYSYAKLGEHHLDGGVLLRKDLHALFDLGLIAIDPNRLIIDLAPDLMNYSHYQVLHGEKLMVDLNTREIKWLQKHWGNFRDHALS
jgi:hypothetical protein